MDLKFLYEPNVKYTALFIGVISVALIGRYAFAITDSTALIAFTGTFTVIGTMLKDWLQE